MSSGGPGQSTEEVSSGGLVQSTEEVSSGGPLETSEKGWGSMAASVLPVEIGAKKVFFVGFPCWL